MKRFLCLVLVLLLLPIVSLADVDLSPYTTEQLYALREIISYEILSRGEYKDVELPQGYYVVGQDIPEGHWSITAAPGSYCLIEYFQNADASGHRPADTFNDYFYVGLRGDGADAPSTVENTFIDLDLKYGYHFVVNYGSCVFNPFVGRPSPFFN